MSRRDRLVPEDDAEDVMLPFDDPRFAMLVYVSIQCCTLE